LQEEALDLTLWRTGFGRGYGLVAKRDTMMMMRRRRRTRRRRRGEGGEVGALLVK
jgi:hypothetical protein